MTENESSGRPVTRREQCRRVRILFSLWRQLRPFWGGSLLVVGGLLVAFLPLYFDQLLLFTNDGFTTRGLLFAVLIMVCGLAALLLPAFSSVLGGLGMLLSTLSLFGALGGFVVGALVSGIGGLLCFAWQPPEDVGQIVRDHAERAGHDPDAINLSFEED